MTHDRTRPPTGPTPRRQPEEPEEHDPLPGILRLAAQTRRDVYRLVNDLRAQRGEPPIELSWEDMSGAPPERERD